MIPFDLIVFIKALGLVAVSQLLAAFLLKDETPPYKFLQFSSIFIGAISFAFFYATLLLIFYSILEAHILILPLGIAIVTTALTDAHALLISRWTSIYLAPVALIVANLGVFAITPLESIAGAFLGFITLSATARIAYKWTGQVSLGQGDIDFLTFIGALLGPAGCWKTLLIGSITGSIFGIVSCTIYKTSTRTTKLPFGTFLAFGAMIEFVARLYAINFFVF